MKEEIKKMYWSLTEVAREMKVANFKVRYWSDVYGVVRFGHSRDRVDAKGRNMLKMIQRLRAEKFDVIGIKKMINDRG